MSGTSGRRRLGAVPRWPLGLYRAVGLDLGGRRAWALRRSIMGAGSRSMAAGAGRPGAAATATTGRRSMRRPWLPSSALASGSASVRPGLRSIGWCPLGARSVLPLVPHVGRLLRSVNRYDVTNVSAINNRNVTINNFANRNAITVVPARAMTESRPVRQVAEHVDPRSLATAHPFIGRDPIRPTAATAGITPRLAEQMHLSPAPAAARSPRASRRPAIHAGPIAHGVAERPACGARPNTGRHPAEEHGATAERRNTPCLVNTQAWCRARRAPRQRGRAR